MKNGISHSERFFATDCVTLHPRSDVILHNHNEFIAAFICLLERTYQVCGDSPIKGPIGGLWQLAVSMHSSFTFAAHSTMMTPQINIFLHTKPVEQMLDQTSGPCLDGL